MNGVGRRATAILAACAAALAVAPAETPPPSDDSGPVAVSPVAPRELAPQAVRRLGGEIAEATVKCREAAAGERDAAARRWLDEVFAPLGVPDCQSVLDLAGLRGTSPVKESGAWPPDRPIATAPAADEVLVPESLAPLTADDVGQLRASGLLPFELALAAECARVVAARHAGPPPKEPLLRLARAARLEGMARLAGVILAAQAAGIEPADLGLVALTAGRDRAGIPQRTVAGAGGDPVRDALLKTFEEDGLRWALFHYRKGGLSAVLAALERPAAGPEALLRPGVSRTRPTAAAGCRLGPRAAAALLTGHEDADWVDVLVDDRWTSDSEGRVSVRLLFESEAAATRAQTDLSGGGIPTDREGPVLSTLLRRRGASRPAS